MNKFSKDKSVNAFIHQIVFGLEEKKGMDITVMSFEKVLGASFDFFIIAHGNSKTQVEALADSVLQTVREKSNVKLLHKEGYRNAEWILLDYGGIVVHIFEKEKRFFYNIEQLWADAQKFIISESIINQE